MHGKLIKYKAKESCFELIITPMILLNSFYLAKNSKAGTNAKLTMHAKLKYCLNLKSLFFKRKNLACTNQ